MLVLKMMSASFENSCAPETRSLIASRLSKENRHFRLYLTRIFRIFFNWEIEICDRYLHLITSRFIDNEENLTNGYISRQPRLISILA